MTDNESPNTAPAPVGPETQRQRWAKYGANVALVSVVVVLIGGFAAAIAQHPDAKARIDTTNAGLYSLKPQTKSIIKDLKDKVRIVSLYMSTKPVAEQEAGYVDYATPVADLLDEYARHSGGKIEVESIDPTKNPGKVDALISDVTERYGGEVKQYRDFLGGVGKYEEEVKRHSADEAKHVTAFDAKELSASQLGQIVLVAQRNLEDTAAELAQSAEGRSRLLAQKPPNYKGAVDEIQSSAETLSSLGTEAARLLRQLKDDAKASDAVKKYAADAAPRYDAIGKASKDLVEQIKKLGELKLDNLRQTLTSREGRNSIVVMGPNDMRVISFENTWVLDANLRRALAGRDKEPKRQFAGEQQITSAILGLTQQKKPKVAFVRAGGPPLTSPGMLFMSPPGQLSRIASRLRDYNFEVLEKDLTGMWAMQQQMQQRGMPPEPEPDDAAIKDAVWIVMGMPAQGGMMGPPPQIAPKIAEHLKAGGSALIMCAPQGEDFSTALADYGIKVRTDAIVVHEPVPATGAQGDFVNNAQRVPFVFVVNDYGPHMLAKPLQSLDMPLVACVPVSTEAKAGVKQWNMIPVPNDPPSWVETSIEPLMQGDSDTVTFDAAKDTKGPLFVGAAAQKEQGEGRVVVLGSWQHAFNDLLRIPDPQLLEEHGIQVARFPGSMELMTNSVFWLSKMEPMIAISPAAMEVSRIQSMSKGAQRFWTVALIGGLPLLVIAAGALMYVRRRD